MNINNFEKKISEMIYYLDDVSGVKFFKEVKKESEKIIKFDKNKENAYLSLQFLIIPFLSTKEIGDLLKLHLILGLEIEDLDLTERITKKLLFIDFKDRDNCKNTLKKSLENNQEIISTAIQDNLGNKINLVSDWIKDYVSSINQEEGSSLRDAKYFYQSQNFVKLNNDEKNLVKKLLNLYKFLNTSSFTPEGFEDDILIKDEFGRLVTTNKGQIIILSDPSKVNKSKQNIAKMPLDDNIGKLEKTLNSYPAGSLERKAVEEEMKRLKNS